MMCHIAPVGYNCDLFHPPCWCGSSGATLGDKKIPDEAVICPNFNTRKLTVSERFCEHRRGIIKICSHFSFNNRTMVGYCSKSDQLTHRITNCMLKDRME